MPRKYEEGSCYFTMLNDIMDLSKNEAPTSGKHRRPVKQQKKGELP